MRRPPTVAFALLVLLVPPALAQGSDNCAAATPLTVTGTFAFDNATATAGPQGQSEAICNFFGSTVVNHDVWFTWMAPSGEEYELSACSLTGVDTKIAVYDGAGCPSGSAIACNDDACNFQSRVTFTTQPGQMYTLQIGTFPSASGGTGSFTLGVDTTPPCAISTGPDVIVGDLLDVGNYNANGPLEALVLGTTACNVGTAPVPWQANTNHHPVIGGNFYRYKLVDGAGRFEQIGMSWLKHGFAAVSGSFCCPCQGGGGDLGVGCSDPYSSGLNGNQSGLGPRWQVDAHTGIFTCPPANPPWSGSTARRIEVRLTDLEPSTTGTRYFGESQYVTPEDSQAGNQNNNGWSFQWTAQSWICDNGARHTHLQRHETRSNPEASPTEPVAGRRCGRASVDHRRLPQGTAHALAPHGPFPREDAYGSMGTAHEVGGRDVHPPSHRGQQRALGALPG